MKLLITGATGYIGQRLVRTARDQCHEVFIAGRSGADISFDLADPQPVILPEKFDAVFHLAAVTSSSATNPDAEIKAAQYLIEAAVQQNTRVIFVSSQVARENAPTDYGRTKWQIEQFVLAANGCSVRPGQVYGGFENGLFGVLATIIRKLPFYPAFLPEPKIQPVHVDDLVAVLLRSSISPGLEASILNIGAENPISFTHFLQAIQHHWIRCFRLPLPVPVVLVQFVIKSVGTKLRTKFGLERLNSLFDLKAMNTRDDLHRLDMQLRSLDSGMHRSGQARRSDLGMEGSALLRYVLGTKPTHGLIRRYVRCIELLRDGQALKLKNFYLRHSTLLYLIDTTIIKQSPIGQEFAWRLNAAIVIAEASKLGAKNFLGTVESPSFIRNGLSMSITVVQEIFWRLMGLLMSPFLKHPFNHSINISDKTE